jgi:hypothetical protein
MQTPYLAYKSNLKYNRVLKEMNVMNEHLYYWSKNYLYLACWFYHHVFMLTINLCILLHSMNK